MKQPNQKYTCIKKWYFWILLWSLTLFLPENNIQAGKQMSHWKKSNCKEFPIMAILLIDAINTNQSHPGARFSKSAKSSATDAEMHLFAMLLLRFAWNISAAWIVFFFDKRTRKRKDYAPAEHRAFHYEPQPDWVIYDCRQDTLQRVQSPPGIFSSILMGDGELAVLQVTPLHLLTPDWGGVEVGEADERRLRTR